MNSVREPITTWHLWNPKFSIWEMNHIENGHAQGDYPLPKSLEFTLQKGWRSGKWQKKHCFLQDGKVIDE